MNAKDPAPTAFPRDRARRYDRSFDASGTDGYALRVRLEDTLRALGSGPGDILDAGMGPGRLCVELAARNWTVSGVDASGEMVALARARIPEAADRLVEGRIEELPFPDASFDAVVATGVLEYSELATAVGELVRVLRPGGTAVVSYPNARALYRIWKTALYYPAIRVLGRMRRRPAHALPTALALRSLDSFVTLLTAAGLRLERHVYSSYVVVLPPLDALSPAVSERAAEWIAGTRPHLGPRLATQVVFSAKKAR